MRNLSLTLILAASLSTVACGPRNSDKLDDNELAGAEGGTSQDTATRCTSRVVSDEIKRQLFARAAEIRGSNGDNYAKIAGFALIEISGAAPVAGMSAGASVECRGHVTLRLPAGLRVAGGRTTLGGDVNYSVAPGPRGTVTLGQSDAIAIPLATLTQTRAAQAPASAPATAEAQAPVAAPVPAPTEQYVPVPTVRRPDPMQPPSPPPAPAARSTASRPSFDCSRARSSSERAVCGSDSLGSLDRTMSSQYRTAFSTAAPAQRRLLAQTRDRFLLYRDRCGSDACIANTYRGRIREIEDIMAGRWHSPR